ncbi:MAG: alpha-L-fucosidase [Clostridia bacterium]|nr:alpha-L-fucosidase [Clostridia bacterium]
MTDTTNKFGMFIHWGFYAQLGLQEQAYARYDIPREEYEALKDTFNPVDYDPEKWVLLAKNAGMKYITFTTKHHDGFCMWNTAYTDYNIMNTPYGKDVLKELADACHKHGMLLSLYYSNPDWHHPYSYNPASSHQWKAVNKEEVKLDVYVQFIKDQMTELLTNYGPIYTMFWDINPYVEDKSINELARKLQPDILINDRGFDTGDFSTPEREYAPTPNSARFTRMTEACNSLGVQSWGYREREDFYSLKHIMSSIDRIMAMGGSYLLNVGPDAKGVITDEYADRLRRVGDWYNRMEGCLVGHESDTFDYGVRGENCLVTRKNGKRYFHFPDGISSTAVTFKNMPEMPKKVRLMNTGDELESGMELLPEFFNGATGKPDSLLFHVRGIPVDELCLEPIVIEMTF